MGALIKTLLVLVGLVAIVLVGGYFALKRGDIPYETLASKYENASSRYVDLPDQVHMHYRDQGNPNGPTILLIHGFSSSLQTWEPWVQRLGGEFHLVSIDLPGHGLTRAPAGYRASIPAFVDDVAAFAHAYGLSHFAVAGNSMGGNVAWEYALAHPDQLDALILVDSGGWPMTARTQSPVFKLISNPTLAPLIRDLDNTTLFRQGLGQSFADPAKADAAMITRYAELSRAPGHRDILMQIQLGQRNVATPDRLAAIHTPTLVIVGEQDHLIPPTDAERFHQAIYGSQLVSLPNCGHIAEEDKPDETAAAVRSFMHALHPATAPPVAAHAAH